MTRRKAPSEGRIVPIQPYFGGFILETLTLGMYGESRNAIREYLQNGFDAVRDAVKAGLIKSSQAVVEISMEHDSLIVRDNGIGLRATNAVSTLTSIGASRKDYREEAGFRGIGRLAGIVFCNSLTFTTKAAAETLQTTVTLNAAGLRHDMSPARGGHLPLEELLQKHIEAVQTAASDPAEHFFEVALEGFHNPPHECTDPLQMISFVSQVAPVPYSKKFRFRSDILTAAKRHSIGIDEVKVLVRAGGDTEEVFKPYGAQFPVGKDSISLQRVEIREGPSNRWWGWIGHKSEPGAYRDEPTKAIRVRVRNIQIDGTQIIGRIFETDIRKATTYGRFNDWFVGEIFVDPTYLVPNARRDGFEDDEQWRSMRAELAEVCSELGAEAYGISRENQHSVQTLAKDARDIETDAKRVIDAEDTSPDKVIEISSRVNKLHRRVTRAFRHADFEVGGQLRSIENRLLDVKTKAVRKLGVSSLPDADEVRQQAQDEVIKLLASAFKEQLDIRTYGKVRKIMEEVLGRSDF